ncbi:fucose mutarotase-like [Oratosquilla oratoria]|uniref:fucose mutarotase-like n=1 Tax=Oratosquilla oratoria TaxID=337810 RepID=UPI003F75FD66
MGRLKGIPHILSPDILHLLASTGHGTEITLADINFPTNRICSGPDGPYEYRADGLKITELLDAILTLMPLDTHGGPPVTLMHDLDHVAPAWCSYEAICNTHHGSSVEVSTEDRFSFYQHARKTYAIIHTGETMPYGNIILRRGVC